MSAAASVLDVARHYDHFRSLVLETIGLLCSASERSIPPHCLGLTYPLMDTRVLNYIAGTLEKFRDVSSPRARGVWWLAYRAYARYLAIHAYELEVNKRCMGPGIRGVIVGLERAAQSVVQVALTAMRQYPADEQEQQHCCEVLAAVTKSAFFVFLCVVCLIPNRWSWVTGDCFAAEAAVSVRWFTGSTAGYSFCPTYESV
jgi:hypothetical protein